MKVVGNNLDLQNFRESCGDGRVAFVPTMGALHAGHKSLIQRARAENEVCVLSIFVNPTQFDSSGDLENYPESLEADLKLARDCGVDGVFLPKADELYADKYNFRLSEFSESKLLCGASRNGHFDGVLTVVLKLFNLVKPHRAYFGEKDFQQLRLIEEMSRALFLDIEIVGCPTVREESGLAMSSRNLRLSPAGRELAAQFPQILAAPDVALESKRLRLERAGIVVDYIEQHWGRVFGAVFVEEVRLIDNFPLTENEKILKEAAQ